MISLDKIEVMAPDQASLDAAKKLLDGKKWPVCCVASDSSFIWGECQGSGSTPYRACVALNDLGYKCTCPSRKFPCKHCLALMWRYSAKAAEFSSGEVPEWVRDWSAKRRTGKTTGNVIGEPDVAKKIAINDAIDGVDKLEQKQDSERAAKTRERNQQQREALIQAGLEDFYVWLADVYDRGLLHFLQNCTANCSQAAKRLVDAKASGLASQLDEMAGVALQTLETERPRYLQQKLSSLYLLAKAYQHQAGLHTEHQQEVRRLLGWTMSREQLLDSPEALRISDHWLVLAVREYLQNDGLRRVETWLARSDENADRKSFAVLMDYHHVSAGNVAPPFRPGEWLEATIAFYPSPTPLRGIIIDHKLLANSRLHLSGQPLKQALAERLMQRSKNPWLPTWPLVVAYPVVVTDNAGQFWLTESGDNCAIPLKHPDRAALLPLLGLQIRNATVTWDGWRGDLLQADTAYGFWSALT
jgi:SWIM zinc finger